MIQKIAKHALVNQVFGYFSITDNHVQVSQTSGGSHVFHSLYDVIIVMFFVSVLVLVEQEPSVLFTLQSMNLPVPGISVSVELHWILPATVFPLLLF